MDKGILYLVGTPIGNLSDMSPRAFEILNTVDMIAAEDTRRTRTLLNKFEIKKTLESYHHFNKEIKGPYLIEKILNGENIALVSDAGMPCISDPGSELVALCADQNIPVVVVPGPCAAVSALSGSGLDTSRFVFEGFLPSSGKPRKDRLKIILKEARTMIFYEAPHRLRKTLKDFSANGWGDRRITFARELTKLYEEFIRMSVCEAEVFYTQKDPRGEYVLILEGLDEFERRTMDNAKPASEEKLLEQVKSMEEQIQQMLTDGISIKEISIGIASSFPVTKKEAYALAQKYKDRNAVD